MPLSLGSYLRSRREAALLSLDDVAARFATEPRYARHVRADWLALIEADIEAPSFMTIVVLAAIYPIDLDVLVALAGPDRRGRRALICPNCGCTDRAPCIDQVDLAACARTSAGGLCTTGRDRVGGLIATVIA